MKNRPFTKFFVALTATMALLIAVYLIVINIFDIPDLIYDIEIFGIQYLIGLLVFFLVLKALSFESQYFVQITILSIVVKLLVYGIFNFIIIYLAPQIAFAHVVLFFGIYLILTALELGMLYPVINSSHKGSKQRKSEVN